MRRFFTAAITFLILIPLYGASYYTDKPDDPRLKVLNQAEYPQLHGDGVGDDSAVLQQAIADAAQNGRVLLVPPGRYRITKTIGIPANTRVIGFGATRPVIVLGPNTPGFAEGPPKYMIWFSGGGVGGGVGGGGAGGRGGGRAGGGGGRGSPSQVGTSFGDSSPGTFYSAMSNVDIEIQDGNPAAVGIRSHYAQHCYLAHIDFHIGSGYAGIDSVGNEAEDLHFFGGDYGIVTTKPAPSWPFGLEDASFDGQRIAAIKTQEAGLTLIRNTFTNVPTVISIDPERAEELWMKDCRFENVSGPALIISEGPSNRPEINLENVVCHNVPTLAKFRADTLRGDVESTVASDGGEMFVIKQYTHGNLISDLGADGAVSDIYVKQAVSALPAPVPSDIPALPPVSTWVNVMKFGAKADGDADDGPAIRAAIAASKVVFFPGGWYKITDTIELKPDTILVGLNPITTQIAILDNFPAFSGPGELKGLVESPKGGTNIVQGIGMDSGAKNNRAVAIKWMAGPNSLIDDVKFLGGHGTSYPDGTGGDNTPQRGWDTEGPSLLVTDGGGGTFADIWTASTFALCGMEIENTTTSGRVYALSSEHHVRNEILIKNSSNWQIDALQMEEELRESPKCQPLEIIDSGNLSFANIYIYRVISTQVPYPQGILLEGQNHDLMFHNLHLYGPSKYAADNTIIQNETGVAVRDREIAYLPMSGRPPQNKAVRLSPLVTPGAAVEKLASGFNDSESLVTDAAGNAYFIDLHNNKILKWDDAKRAISVIRQGNDAGDPYQLAMDKAGDLMVITSSRRIYSFRPDFPDQPATTLTPVPAADRPGLIAILPDSRWRDGHDFQQMNMQSDAARAMPMQVLSPDGTAFIPLPAGFGAVAAGGRGGRGGGGGGAGSSGVSALGVDYDLGSSGPPANDLLRTYQLGRAMQGQRFYVADEMAQETWSYAVNPNGSLSDPKKLCEFGEGGVTVDASGNIYVCAGNIYVFDPSGKQIDVIRIPDRPFSLAFGGPDRQTLFIAARGGFYCVRMQAKGM